MCRVSTRFHGTINEVVSNVGLEGKYDFRKSMILPGKSRSSPLPKQRETHVTSGQWQEIEYRRIKHYKRAKGNKGSTSKNGQTKISIDQGRDSHIILRQNGTCKEFPPDSHYESVWLQMG